MIESNYRENNKEKIKIKFQKFRDENKNKIALKDKKYRENNKEKIALYQKQRYYVALAQEKNSKIY